MYVLSKDLRHTDTIVPLRECFSRAAMFSHDVQSRLTMIFSNVLLAKYMMLERKSQFNDRSYRESDN